MTGCSFGNIFASFVVVGMLAGSPASAKDDGKAAATIAAPLTTADKHAIVERAAALLEKRYVNPQLGARYAAVLRHNAARGDYSAIAESAALAARMTADLQAVSPDGHLKLYRVEPQSAAAPATALSSVGPVTALEGQRSIAPGIRAMRWIEPGVAYISFEHFDDRPEAIAAATRFLNDYASARALIIDSRANHGGAFDMMGLFANHFFGKPRLLANMDMSRSVVEDFGAPFPVDGKILKRTDGPDGLVRFQHWAVPIPGGSPWFKIPIYYLTSRQTFSAAEHMAMILKNTKRATLIGEASGGGNHFGGTEPVGGGLELFVPIGHTTDPVTGADWESVGITPDVSVSAGDALEEALRRIHAERP